MEQLEHRWCPTQGFSLVTSRTALAGTDSVDWGTITTNGVANPFTILSTAGRGVTVGKTIADNFINGTECPSSTVQCDWNGNFAPGDKILWTTDVGSQLNNPITLNFGSTAVAAGGAQIQPDASSNFTAEVQALDASGNILASFKEVGKSTGAADNSAIFIGISSTSANIYRIALSLIKAPLGLIGDFAINKFDFRTSTLVAAPAVRQSVSALGLAPLVSSPPGVEQPAAPAAPTAGPPAPSVPTSSQVARLPTSSAVTAVHGGAAEAVFAGSKGRVTDDTARLFESLFGKSTERI